MTEGDTFFIGEDSRRDPTLLEPGLYARGDNIDCRQGVAETRRGMRSVFWACRLGVNFPISFPFSFTEPSGLGRVLGAGVFSDPYGYKWILVATPAGVWRVREGSIPELIPYGRRVLGDAVSEDATPGFVLFLCLDQTGSIGTAGAQRGIEIIEQFRGQVGDSRINGIGFLSFGDTLCEVYPISSDVNAVQARLQAVVDSGGSDPVFFQDGGGDTPENGVDALDRALDEISSSPIAQASRYRYIFLKTDTAGYAHQSADPEETAARLLGAEVSRTWLEFDAEATSEDDDGTYSETFPADANRVFHGDFDPDSAPTLTNTSARASTFNGLDVSERLQIVQAYNRVFLFRGRITEGDISVAGNPRPLTWEGRQEFSDRDLGYFEEISKEPKGSNLAMPAASRAVYFNNRLFALIGNRMPFSDLVDYTAWRIIQEWFLNDGSADQLVEAKGLGGQMVCFKSGSIWLLDNVYGDLSNVTAQVISSERGCWAPRTVAQAGKDMPFLAYGGVWMVSQALDNRLQANAEPLSAPIEPRMREINWEAARDACAVVHGSRYYLAVPIHGARYNNAILVYDFINRAWLGGWTGEWLDVAELLVGERCGEDRVLAVMGSDAGLAATGDTANQGAIFALDVGLTDNRWGTDAEIPDLLRTRGYAGGDPRRKRFTSLETEIESWNGAWETILLRDGVNEERALGERTKDRAKNYLADAPRYDATNVNGGQRAPYREDYSMLASGVPQRPIEEITETSENWTDPLPPGIYLTGGLQLEKHQLAREGFKLREPARSVQVEIRGTRGRRRLVSVKVDSTSGEDKRRTEA